MIPEARMQLPEPITLIPSDPSPCHKCAERLAQDSDELSVREVLFEQEQRTAMVNTRLATIEQHTTYLVNTVRSLVQSLSPLMNTIEQNGGRMPSLGQLLKGRLGG